MRGTEILNLEYYKNLFSGKLVLILKDREANPLLRKEVAERTRSEVAIFD